jgi:hypothetical protein
MVFMVVLSGTDPAYEGTHLGVILRPSKGRPGKSYASAEEKVPGTNNPLARFGTPRFWECSAASFSWNASSRKPALFSRVRDLLRGSHQCRLEQVGFGLYVTAEHSVGLGAAAREIPRPAGESAGTSG